MALLSEIHKPTPLPPPPKRFKHHVLFSYAAEDEEYVNAVHAALPPEVNVFNYKRTGIWGRKLAKELEHIYKNEAPFCVVFFSEAYFKSEWTEKELAVVSRVEAGKPGYMLPVVLDGPVPEAIKEIAWLDNTHSAKDLADRIVAKIQEPPPKPWWFYLSMQAKVAIAAVLLALIVFTPRIINHFRPSRTQVMSVNATEQVITATVKNSGPKSATIVGQRLRFGALPIEDAELRLDKSAAAIAPGDHALTLTVLTLETKCDAEGIRPNKYKVEPLLDRQFVTLEIDIRESDDAPGKSRRQIVTIPAARLKPLVRKWVQGYDSDCG
jgi:hypothetical protein